MTIIEVLKTTGKRFRRKGTTDWLSIGYSVYYFTPAEILADDWGIEVPKKELSAEDVTEAFWDSYSSESGRATLKTLLRELGLE